MAVSDIEVDKCAIRNTCERRNEADIQNVKVWKITIAFLFHGQSTDSEWEAKRESVKHNLRLLLDPVSVFKGQTLKNRCHCFQTVICTKEDCGLSHNVSVRFKDIKMS